MDLEIICRYPVRERLRRPALLFVHGAFCGAWVWDEHFLPYFADRGYQACALSLRGHGRSTGRDQLPWAGLADYVADLQGVISRLGRPPVLIGHSLGGVIVQRYVRTQRAPAVILMASGPPHGMLPSAVGMAFRNPLLFQELCLVSAAGLRANSLELLMDALFSKAMPRPEAMRYMARMQGESARISLELMWPDFPSAAANLSMPLLVLGAEQDAFVSPLIVHATARVYGTTAEILADVSHAMMLDVGWEGVAQKVAAWLEDVLERNEAKMG